jgi:glycosyltransferase involved in cell wall biosynthesis
MECVDVSGVVGKGTMTNRLLFVVNTAEFFLSHRLAIAIGAQEQGFEVHVATGPTHSGIKLEKWGFHHHIISLSRSGKNPFTELRSVWVIYALMRQLKPDIVHLVTIKPVLYGGIVARAARVHAVVAAISGLGSVFITDGMKALILRRLVNSLYKLALGHKNSKVIFQNLNDMAVLVKLGAVKPKQAILIRGSGVALNEYPFLPEPVGSPVVTFAARLLKDKGVCEFVAAACLLTARGVQASFWLIGSPDPENPATISERELDVWKREGTVDCLGYRQDIPMLFARSNIIVLPSYREGLPKVLIEAAAAGRAIVTTDVAGCRDAIEPDQTGLLVPVRDVEALADAIERLIRDAPLRKRMGQAGRKLAERVFSIDKIVAAHLDVYRQVSKTNVNSNV